MFAVGKRHERGFFAVEKFFDDDFFAGCTKAFANQNIVNGGFGFLTSADHHAFAGGEAVGFDDIGRFLLADIAWPLPHSVNVPKDRGWNVVVLKDFLGEGFAAFELRGSFIRPKNS